MKLKPQVRNVLIIVVLAAIVAGVSGGETAASFVIQVVGLLFLAATAWIASRLYREHRVTIYSLGSKRRAILYGVGGIATLTLSASSRLMSSGPGTVAWILLLAACAYAIYAIFRSMKQY